ncbi:type II secretion system protein [Comamonas flocculans]
MASVLRSRLRGFSLLELLVAISIMALALGVLYRAMAGSAQAAATVEQRQSALAVAQSLLWANADLPSEGWWQDGQSGPYKWSVRSTPYPTEVERTTPSAVPLQRLQVVVSWGGADRTHSLELSTLLAQRPPLALAGGVR